MVLAATTRRALSSDRGFTLVEVVIAIVLVGVLSGVVVVGVGQLNQRGTTAACQASLDAARAAATVHASTTGSAATSFNDLTATGGLTLPAGVTVSANGRAVLGAGWFVEMSGTPASFTCGNGVPTVPWTPANLSNLALWLDAADSSTVALNGSTVSQWRDRSGNNRHWSQPTPSNQPGYGATTLNGRPALTFNGSTQWFLGTQTYLVADMFAVANAAAPKVYAGLMTGPQSELILSATGNAVIDFVGTARVNGTLGTSITFGQPFLWGQVGYGTQGRTLGQEVNVQGAVRAWAGSAAEIVLTSTSLSTLDRQRVEGYLAHKWGLASQLPVGHPFRDAAPTV